MDNESDYKELGGDPGGKRGKGALKSYQNLQLTFLGWAIKMTIIIIVSCPKRVIYQAKFLCLRLISETWNTDHNFTSKVNGKCNNQCRLLDSFHKMIAYI